MLNALGMSGMDPAFAALQESAFVARKNLRSRTQEGSLTEGLRKRSAIVPECRF
jgi:hypothetical protein